MSELGEKYKESKCYDDITEYKQKIMGMESDDLFWLFKISDETKSYTFDKFLEEKYVN